MPSNNVHIFIDFETLGMPENKCAVLSVAAIKFTDDELENLDFGDITVDRFKKSGIQIKFDVRDQVKRHNRTTDPGTVAWWKKQSEAAQSILKADPDLDVTIEEGIEHLFNWIPDVDPKNIIWWARGTNFDLPLLTSLMKDAKFERFMAFWNYRDVRSFIAGCMLNVTQDRVPLDQSQMVGFVAHDALSDCAKDCCMIFSAMRYASGADLPVDPHPDTVPYRR